MPQLISEWSREDELVRFLESYRRLNSQDVCAQNISDADLVVWVHANGVWENHLGIKRKGSGSWCQVYLTSILGLSPAQYAKAKKELFTSTDGFTGVYKHRTKPLYALVYKPATGLSSASIAAMTAGGAAVVGVGGFALRHLIKSKPTRSGALQPEAPAPMLPVVQPVQPSGSGASIGPEEEELFGRLVDLTKELEDILSNTKDKVLKLEDFTSLDKLRSLIEQATTKLGQSSGPDYGTRLNQIEAAEALVGKIVALENSQPALEELLEIPSADLDDVQKFKEHIDKLTDSAAKLNRYLELNKQHAVDKSEAFMQFASLLEATQPFEENASIISPGIYASEMKYFRDLAMKTQALINAQSSGHLIEQMFNGSYFDIVSSNAWKNHQADVTQYIILADNDDLTNALLATQLYESIQKAGETWYSNPSLGAVLDQLEPESECVPTNKCPFRKLIQELEYSEIFDELTERSAGELETILTTEQNTVIAESDLAEYKGFRIRMFADHVANTNSSNVQKFIKLLDEASALSETKMALSEIDAFFSKEYDDILNDKTWKSPAFQNFIKITRDNRIERASRATQLFESISKILSGDELGHPEPELDQLRQDARKEISSETPRKEISSETPRRPFQKALDALRAKFPGDSALWIDTIRKDIEDVEREIKSTLAQVERGPTHYVQEDIVKIIKDYDQQLGVLDNNLRQYPEQSGLSMKVSSLRELVRRMVALTNLKLSKANVLVYIASRNRNEYSGHLNPNYIEFARTMQREESADVDQFLERFGIYDL